MDGLFRWIEESELSIWLTGADSIFAFPAAFTLHVVSVAIVAGVSIAFALRLLGLLPQVPGVALVRFASLFWIGLGLSVVSGVLLLVAFPTKTLTNPLFYLKLAAILGGVLTVIAMRRTIFSAPVDSRPTARERGLAAGGLALWAASIAGGRLLAYTYTRLTVDFSP